MWLKCYGVVEMWLKCYRGGRNHYSVSCCCGLIVNGSSYYYSTFTMGPKHHRLSLKEKVSVIHLRERENLSVRKLFERFEVSRSQIKDILRNKQSILKSWNRMDSGELFFRPPKTSLNFPSEHGTSFHPSTIPCEDISLRKNPDQSLLSRNQKRSTCNHQETSENNSSVSEEGHPQRNLLQETFEDDPSVSEEEEYPQRDAVSKETKEECTSNIRVGKQPNGKIIQQNHNKRYKKKDNIDIIEENLEFLKVLADSSPRLKRQLIENANGKQLNTICRVSRDLLAGQPQLSKNKIQKLSKYKKDLRNLAASNKKTTVASKRLLIKRTGFVNMLAKAILG